MARHRSAGIRHRNLTEKFTFRLTHAQQRALSEAATRQGLASADLVREGIALVLAREVAKLGARRTRRVRRSAPN